jgi:hypothetical protein
MLGWVSVIVCASSHSAFSGDDLGLILVSVCKESNAGLCQCNQQYSYLVSHWHYCSSLCAFTDFSRFSHSLFPYHTMHINDGPVHLIRVCTCTTHYPILAQAHRTFLLYAISLTLHYFNIYIIYVAKLLCSCLSYTQFHHHVVAC